MYLEHYHLKLKPFDLSPSPNFLWLGEKHQEALATLNYGVVGGLGFLLLTGDVGVGKTALIHRLIGGLDASTIVAHITDPSLGTLDFFRLLAAEFNLPGNFRSKGEFLIELENFLHKAHGAHKKVLLIVDEAQRLNTTLLDQIRVLSNIELTDRKLINIFLVGQPEFKNMLMADDNRALRQRIAINYHIDPLTESETGQYIEHRLKVAGADRSIFKSDAVGEVFRFTHGIPRAINNICDLALLTGYVAGLESIDADVVRECGQALDIRPDVGAQKNGYQRPNKAVRPATALPPLRRSPVKGHALRIGMGIVGIVLGVLGSYYLLWPPVHRWSRIPLSSPKPTQSATEHLYKIADTPLPAEPAGPKPPPHTSPQTPLRLAQNKVPGNVPAGDQPLAADRQAVTATKPDRSTPVKAPLIREADTDAAASEKAQKTLAAPAVPAAPPAAIPPPTIPQHPSVNQQEESIPAGAPSVNARQPVAFTPQAKPAPDPLPVVPAGNSDTAVPEKVPKELAVAAVSPVAEPPSPPEKIAQTGETTTRPETTALTSAVAKETMMAEGPSTPSTASPSLTSTRSSATARTDRQLPAKESTRPNPVSAAPRPEPIITASTGPPPAQASTEPADRAAPGAEKPTIGSLENRLRVFLQNYCATYAAKNLDAFADYFADGALENGKPFASLVSKYERNFNYIETIQYRIELGQFSYDAGHASVNINGNFFLKWLPPDQKWRQNAGKISMHLKENGSSFLVQQLDYYSTLSKKND